jgi:hypothetical protein
MKLLDNENNLYAVATVAVGFALQQDEVAVKDYEENSGILKSLVDARVLEYPHRHISQGFVTIPICRITPYYFEKYCVEPKTHPFPNSKDLKYTGYFTEN